MPIRDAVGLGTRTRKLRLFSGTKDSEPSVVDYDMWRMHDSSVVGSTQLSKNERKNILTDSLLHPALDSATTLEATKTSQELLDVLDHHFGTVSDGYELYSQFRFSIQDVKETACEYLQRLHLLALKATQREGMRKQNISKEVFRQLESSCADKDLLNWIDIQGLLEEETLPSVDEVLLLVRNANFDWKPSMPEPTSRRFRKVTWQWRWHQYKRMWRLSHYNYWVRQHLELKVCSLELTVQVGINLMLHLSMDSCKGLIWHVGGVMTPVGGDKEDSSLAKVRGRWGSVSCVAGMVIFRLPARFQGMLSWFNNDCLLQFRGLMGLSMVFRERIEAFDNL